MVINQLEILQFTVLVTKIYYILENFLRTIFSKVDEIIYIIYKYVNSIRYAYLKVQHPVRASYIYVDKKKLKKDLMQNYQEVIDNNNFIIKESLQSNS